MTTKAVKNMQVGDHIDLEGDNIADPPGSVPEYPHEFEYAEIYEIERETADCIVLYTSQGTFGFPPGHQIKMRASADHKPMGSHSERRDAYRQAFREGRITWEELQAFEDALAEEYKNRAR